MVNGTGNQQRHPGRGKPLFYWYLIAPRETAQKRAELPADGLAGSGKGFIPAAPQNAAERKIEALAAIVRAAQEPRKETKTQ